MRFRFLSMTIVSLMCCLTGLETPLNAGEPENLFDGKSLEHWQILKCEAEVQDGAVLLKSGNGLVQSKKQYGDFTFEFEWKALNKKMWDSGVYFRYAKVPDGRPWPNQYQVNLRKEMEGDLAGFKNGTNPVPVKPHAWNRFELTVKGTTASLKVNGKTAWQVDGIKTTRGYIALQAEVPGGGQFLFRNLRITQR